MKFFTCSCPRCGGMWLYGFFDKNWKEMGIKWIQHPSITVANSVQNQGEINPLHIVRVLTPHSVIFLKKTMKIMPKTKVIHLVRNPLDCVASQKQYIYKPDKNSWWLPYMSKEERKRYDKGTEIEKYAIVYNITTRAGMQCSRKKNYYIVRYEDLVNSPKAEMRKIFNFLGVIGKENLIEKFAKSTKPSIGKYKKVLNKKQIKDVIRINKQIMEALKYEH